MQPTEIIPLRYWLLYGGADTYEVSCPTNGEGWHVLGHALRDRLQGFDNEQVINAICATKAPAEFVIWQWDTENTSAARANDDSPDKRIPEASPAPELTGYSERQFKLYFSPTFGLVFKAPETWIENKESRYFQVVDPATGTSLTASAYEQPDISLKEWGKIRLAIVEQGMPYLEPIGTAREMKGQYVTGILGEYRGVFPDNNYVSRYLVLCLRKDKISISVSFVAKENVYQENEAWYLWLLENQLAVYEVKRITMSPIMH